MKKKLQEKTDKNIENKKQEETIELEKDIENKIEPEKAQNNLFEENIKDQLVRINADFQNYKKRTEKERSNWAYLAKAEELENFIPFFEDLDRAIELYEKQDLDKEQAAWIDGFSIIQKNLKTTLKKLGIEEIDCSGEFNPDFHEALMQVDSDKHKTGKIVQILSKGYLFKGKVLKHAKVSVAK